MLVTKEKSSVVKTPAKTFTLSNEETQELLDTGFVIVDDVCITMVDDEFQVWSPMQIYDFEIKLNYGGRK